MSRLAYNGYYKENLNRSTFTNPIVGNDGRLYKTIRIPKLSERAFWMLRTLRNLFAKSNSELIEKAMEALCRENNIDPELLLYKKATLKPEASLKDLSNLQLLNKLVTPKEPNGD